MNSFAVDLTTNSPFCLLRLVKSESQNTRQSLPSANLLSQTQDRHKAKVDHIGAGVHEIEGILSHPPISYL